MVGTILTGVAMETANTERTDMTGSLREPTREAMARAAEFMERALDGNAWAESGGVLGGPANFDGEDLRPLGARLKGLKLPALSARGACLVGMDLTGVALQGANLEGADLRGAGLRGADLRGARLGGALLNQADLRGAILSPLPLGGGRSMPVDASHASLRYARLEGTDMTGVNFTGADLRGVDHPPEQALAVA
jgi:uncharacterized protein YjbI with pentapeptide repeats